jgi:hypothetical protein
MISGMRGERELEEKARFSELASNEQRLATIGDDWRNGHKTTTRQTRYECENLATAMSGVQVNGLNKALKHSALYAPRFHHPHGGPFECGTRAERRGLEAVDSGTISS